MKKTIALLSTILLAGATSLGSIVNANALLTPPNVVFDIAFRNNGNYGSWYYYLGDGITATPFWDFNNPGVALPTFERTVDGAYYNYTNTTNFGGLEITQTYNRSNTGWNLYQGGPNYVPYLTNKIGSDNTVGAIVNKLYFEFDNQTSNNYALYFDSSSMVGSHNFNQTYDFSSYGFAEQFIRALNTDLTKILIPAYSTYTIYVGFSSGSWYFDAFYLQDLGVSDSYTMGYTDGQNDQIFDSPGGIFSIMGSAFGAVSNIFNIQILPGSITLGTVFGAIIAIAVLFAFLNLLSANPRMGKKK